MVVKDVWPNQIHKIEKMTQSNPILSMAESNLW